MSETTATAGGGAMPGPAASSKTTPAFRKLVVASSLGSAIEHYDFFIYAFTAPLVFDHFFFPKMDSVASMMAVYATFAVGFVARPLGGMVFGHFGDKIGRKAMLMMTFLIMGVASFLIGCLPSYDSVGLLAPLGLVFLRFMQGFAFGGEYMNAVSLTLENAPQAKRGFFASWVNASGPIGIIVASGLIALLSSSYGRDEFINWVWRIPFLFSFILVVLGTYIRHSVDESLLLKKKQESSGTEKAPILTALKSWKKSIVLGCLANMVHSSFQYLSTVFVIGYAVRTLGMSQGSVTSGPMFANIAEMIMVPIIAHYSDRFGRKPFMILGIVLAMIWFPIFFQILALKDPLLLIGGLVVSIGLIHGLMFAPEAAFTAELFPTEVRVSGSSLGKQFGIIFGGGMAPLIATWLMGMWGGSTVPVIVYFEVIAVLAFVGMLLAPENSKKVLD
ncbi:MAG: MHS family MFS transporter [Rhodoplanes sp.]|uniref:MFS transporter n=1 Tax=Rhodoplanes sp. TaxID=1968906 RepID=UPI00183EDCAA|nr:MFS transporter [Rhodoplanes sp.]NVO16804.1 MHS family MFS transporter [Rhodoplanes sp.]